MARAFGNLIAETIAAPGLAAFGLGTAAPGCRLVATATVADGTAIANGDVVEYLALAVDGNGNPNGAWEIGEGTFTTGSPNTLARTTIIESSNANAAVNFAGSIWLEVVTSTTARDVAATALAAFSGAAVPATPAEGQRLFSRRRAGRDILTTIAASGQVREIGPQIGPRSIRFATPLPNNNGITTVGLSMNAIGTNTARGQAASPLFQSGIRLGNVSAASAGAAGGWRTTGAVVNMLRGGAAGIGGFYIVCRFGVSAFTSDGRLFVGLLASTAVIGNVDPSTLASLFGIGCDSADSNLQLITNDASGLAAKTDLGGNFPAKTANTDLYELRLSALPNGSSIEWSVERLNTGDLAGGSVTASGDLPAATAFMQVHLWINNGATASAVGIDVFSLYQESPV